MLTALLLAMVCADSPHVTAWQASILEVRARELSAAQKAVDDAKPDTPASRKANAVLAKLRARDVLSFATSVKLGFRPEPGTIGYIDSAEVVQVLSPTQVILQVSHVIEHPNELRPPDRKTEMFVFDVVSTKKLVRGKTLPLKATYEVTNETPIVTGVQKVFSVRIFDVKKWKPDIPADK